MNTAATAHHWGSSVIEQAGTDDPFHDPVVIGIGIAFILVTVVILALTGLVAWGNLYHSPSWGSHAYPPAIVH